MKDIKRLVGYLDRIHTLNTQERRRREDDDVDFMDENDYPLVVGESNEIPECRKHKQAWLKERKLQQGKEYRSLMRGAVRAFNASPQFSGYRLRENDLNVIAAIFDQTRSDFDVYVNARDIVKSTRELSDCLSERISFIIDLVDREILSFSRPNSSDYHHDISAVIESNLTLNSLFLNLLMGRNPMAEVRVYLREHLAVSERPMNVICRAMRIFTRYYQEVAGDLHEQEGFRYGNTFNVLMDTILDRISALPDDHPVKDFRASYPLNDFEIKTLLLAYYAEHEIQQPLESVSIANLLARNEDEFDDNMRALIGRNALSDHGLIKKDFVRSRKVFWVSLTDKANAGLDLSLGKDGKVADADRIISDTNLLSPVKISQTIEQLILPKDTMQLLSETIARMKDPARFDLARWGLLAASLSSDTASINGCNILLHGQPGTGKTFVAGVIANELGRDLILIDAGSVRNCYYGETEKRVKELFQQMRKIVKAAKIAPVFLLNEAEQLIHKRIVSGRGSTDNVENAIQSIFLEELETFPGVFIATTNLVDSLDEAMSRRFHYKLELGLPDRAARKKLWRLHLPASIPGAESIDCSLLAARYPFTGGQIRIVVQNACYRAMSRYPQDILSLDDLITFAEKEGGSNFEAEAKVVGFKV